MEKKQLDRLNRIIQTQTLLAQADLNLATFMQLIVDTLQDLTDAKGAVVELVDGDYMVYRSASGSISEHVGLRLLRANSLSGLCVSSGQILRCDDADIDPRVDASACKNVGVRSMICTPLFERGVPVGVLKVMSAQTNGFDEDDLQTLELMGATLGAALGKQLVYDEMVHIQAKLQTSEERIRAILEHANDAVISIDIDGVVTQWNRSSEQLFGWKNRAAMGRNIVDLVVPIASRSTFISALKHFDFIAEANRTSQREILAVDREGKELAVEVSLSVNNDPEKFELTAFLRDISERKKLEKALSEMALSDGLTGLPNRRCFMESLHQAIARQLRQNNGLALLFMDLNGFKKINDTYGHETGDLLLKEFASRVSACLRESDTMARLGGDEFVVLAEGIRVVEHAKILAQKIITALKSPLPGSAIMISTSIGISIYEAPANAAQFLSNADCAMYKAKRNGANLSTVATYLE